MSGSTPRISTVIPYSPEYTPSDLLERAKKSVEDQEVETELIVVHDPDSKGPSWARNEGIRQSDTRYVAFLDADDVWMPNKLQRQLNEMEQTGAGISVQNESIDQETFMRELYLGNIQSITSSIVVDTEQVSQPQFNEDLVRREDHLFILKAASKGGICFREDLFEVGGHEESFASNTPTLFRLHADIAFASVVRETVPEIRQYLNRYYAHIQCDTEYDNTLGDVFRLLLQYPYPWVVPIMLISILCQRL